MVKKRPVVVISPRLRHRTGLCIVVPLSTTAPTPVLAYHHHIQLGSPLGPTWPDSDMWAKCDMLYTVSFDRLDRFHQRDHEGKRKYYTRNLNPEELKGVLQAVTAYLTY